MAIPVINSTTSILSFAQWHYFEFQPFATNVPTSWAISGELPAGIELNTETGLLSGAGESDGIYVFGLVATNGDGSSEVLVITLRITPSAAPLTTSGYAIDIDVITREVKLVSGDRVFAKAGDDLLLFCRFKNGDTVLDLDLDSLTLGLKELISDPVLITGSAWHKFGTGTGTYYALHVQIAKESVRAALSNWETTDSIEFSGKTEIEWVENYSAAGWAEAPEKLRMTTKNFPIVIADDMVEAA